MITFTHESAGLCSRCAMDELQPFCLKFTLGCFTEMVLTAVCMRRILRAITRRTFHSLSSSSSTRALLVITSIITVHFHSFGSHMMVAVCLRPASVDDGSVQDWAITGSSVLFFWKIIIKVPAVERSSLQLMWGLVMCCISSTFAFV